MLPFQERELHQNVNIPNYIGEKCEEMNLSATLKETEFLP